MLAPAQIFTGVNGMNLDGATMLPNADLLMAFDESGSIASVDFTSTNALEFNPGGNALGAFVQRQERRRLARRQRGPGSVGSSCRLDTTFPRISCGIGLRGCSWYGLGANS